MCRKQKITAKELLHLWFCGRTLTMSELQCRRGETPHSGTGLPGWRACPAHEAGWMDGKEEDLARHMRPRLLLAEREDRIR